MYPSTKFIIEDRSAIPAIPLDEQVNAPLFAQFFSSDKGPEEMGIYYGEEFEVFGQPNFARHGQPFLQAQTLINNGARVLAKRVVAPDATLANLIVLAKIKKVESQMTDEDGVPLYLTPEGEVTIVPDGNTPYMASKCNIKYELRSITDNHNDIESIKASAEALGDYSGSDEGEKIFPLFVVCDNGRGVSSKKFKIAPNYGGSRNKSYLSYVISVIEDSYVIESTVFTLNPSIVSSTSNLSLNTVARTYLKEIRAYSFDDVMTSFIETISRYSGIALTEIDQYDILFGKDKKGNALDVFEVDEEINISIPVGMPLKSGTNGSFDISPLKSPDYATALVEAFNGTFTDDIYDVDNIPIDLIIDANYPADVKVAIESLVKFREDCVFLQDIGLNASTGGDMIAAADTACDSRYVAVYGNSYDVIDPYSKKQITVTVGYSLARILPKHLSEKRHAPLAGQLHGFIFDEIVEGTVNFLPKIIPGKDQKEELFENRVNFISYFNNIATMESEYTTQKEHTGFSYINNTLAVQEVVKAIRAFCPKNRYSFMEGDDLVKYQEDVQAVLDKFKSNFGSLEMEYMADPTYEQNGIFYAVLKVRFKKFVQAELFRIIAINDDDTVADLT